MKNAAPFPFLSIIGIVWMTFVIAKYFYNTQAYFIGKITSLGGFVAAML